MKRHVLPLLQLDVVLASELERSRVLLLESLDVLSQGLVVRLNVGETVSSVSREPSSECTSTSFFSRQLKLNLAQILDF